VLTSPAVTWNRPQQTDVDGERVVVVLARGGDHRLTFFHQAQGANGAFRAGSFGNRSKSSWGGPGKNCDSGPGREIGSRGPRVFPKRVLRKDSLPAGTTCAGVLAKYLLG
jgi:hypothetical protein